MRYALIMAIVCLSGLAVCCAYVIGKLVGEENESNRRKRNDDTSN